ncbi:MAG TPA: glucosyl-3-phosphoglycerate synthase [Solirubrobacteraceae bacterium]|jgi:glucosyl-3-phosphoglycerate synthase|nr:glucosyl-3-phosphoglycerate synthase [Solirubrobacteraceae bacterium]
MATADARARDDASNERAKARSFHHSEFSIERIAAARAEHGLSVSLCLPARECAQTVGPILDALAPLREARVIDQLLVVDAASPDGTAEIAARAGADVRQEAELLPEHGPVLGKGDAMWRALTVLDGELVCFLDADSEHFSAHFATGLLGPLLCEPDVSFVKAFYRRPLISAAQEEVASSDAAVALGASLTSGTDSAEGGGRVNHLTARPALALLYPQLAQIRQPLAGEVAARRTLLERLPFVTGYGVEVAMLIDAWRAVGIEAIAQVDLDEHYNQHKPLAELAPMALTVLATIARRVERDGRLTLDDDAPQAPLERPPMRELLARADATADVDGTGGASGA